MELLTEKDFAYFHPASYKVGLLIQNLKCSIGRAFTTLYITIIITITIIVIIIITIIIIS